MKNMPPMALDATSESHLIDAARAGDAEAIAALMERHQDGVYRFAMSMCRHPEDAREVLQDTLLAGVRAISGFRGESSVSTWLYAIARSYCIKKRRRGKYAPTQIRSLDDEEGWTPELVSPWPGPEDEAERDELLEALGRAIRSMSPNHREVLVLRDVEGFTAPEVGRVLGLQPGAVKSRLHRARKALRERLTPMLSELGGAEESGCPDVLDMLSHHLEGELAPEVCVDMERHLETCPSCSVACDSLRRVLHVCGAIRAPKVPDDLQAQVKRALREMLAQHG
jgi:RNA polymerase sigma-70 factor (ECF subfamily)